MVSVIIPTFNRRSFLQTAVSSVLAQTFRDFELLIVDDGSQDGTGEVFDKLGDRRVRYLFRPHGGVSAARNFGIREARFDWISFLDSDDAWRSTKLARQIEELEDHPEYRAIYTDEIWIRRGRRVNPRKIHRKYGGWIYRRCLPRCIISPSSILLHRRILERRGLFDESLPVCEDYDLWLRVSALDPIYFLPEPLIIKQGGHADQLSRSTWGLDRYRIKALLKACEGGGLSCQQQEWTAREIATKASILVSGCEKRGKTDQADFYRSLVKSQDPGRTLATWSRAAEIADWAHDHVGMARGKGGRRQPGGLRSV